MALLDSPKKLARLDAAQAIGKMGNSVFIYIYIYMKYIFCFGSTFHKTHLTTALIPPPNITKGGPPTIRTPNVSL